MPTMLLSSATLSIIAVAVVSLICGAVSGAAPPAEVAALMDLFESTQGKNWTSYDGWGNGDPCENYWEGVRCVNGGIL
jgi:hypothetical protein